MDQLEAERILEAKAKDGRIDAHIGTHNVYLVLTRKGRAYSVGLYDRVEDDRGRQELFGRQLAAFGAKPEKNNPACRAWSTAEVSFEVSISCPPYFTVNITDYEVGLEDDHRDYGQQFRTGSSCNSNCF